MSKEQDELLERAKKLRESTQSARTNGRQRQEKSGFSKAQKQFSDMQEGYTQITGTIGWLYRNIISPIVAHPWTGKPFRWYRTLWEKIVYIPAKEASGEPEFSTKRAGLMVLATLVCLHFLPAIFSTSIEFIWDTSRMATSYKSKEIWYLGKSQEIDPAGNIFSAQGCESVECSDQTSIYFRIKPSLAHQLWSLYNYGNFFFPDFVAGGIQNDINKCEVTGYGSRLKFLVRNWDIYPQILSVTCVPLSENEILNARKTAPTQ